MIPLRPFKTFANKTDWQFGQAHRSRKSTMDWTVLLCFDSAVADFCLSTARSNKFCVLANWVKNTMNVQCDPRWSWTIPAASWNALSLVSPFLWRSKRLAKTLALNLKKIFHPPNYRNTLETPTVQSTLRSFQIVWDEPWHFLFIKERMGQVLTAAKTDEFGDSDSRHGIFS